MSDDTEYTSLCQICGGLPFYPLEPELPVCEGCGRGKPQLAEEMPIGTSLQWSAAPRVVSQVGTLPFAAPSSLGNVFGSELVDGVKLSLIRFRYRTPGGGIGWSEPIAVLAKQPAKVVPA